VQLGAPRGVPEMPWTCAAAFAQLALLQYNIVYNIQRCMPAEKLRYIAYVSCLSVTGISHPFFLLLEN
jgi:hypothetical protein